MTGIYVDFLRKINTWSERVFLNNGLRSALFILMFMSFLRLPEVPADETHDRSSAVTFDYYTLKSFKYGRDVIVNVGPYGYLHYSRLYTGMHTVQKYLFGAVFALVVASLMLRTAEMFPSATTCLAWMAVVLSAPTQIGNPLWTMGESFDYRCNFLIILSACYLYAQSVKRGPRFFDGFLVAFLALIALGKGTSMVMVGLLGTSLVVVQVLQRNWARLASGIAIFWAAFLALWFLGGQDVSNLSDFFLGIFLFSSGYNEALMFVDDAESIQMLMGILAVALPSFLLGRLVFTRAAQRPVLLTYLLFCLGFGFILWKHSLVRGGREPLFWNVAITSLPPLVAAGFHIASHCSSQWGVGSGVSQRPSGFSPVHFFCISTIAVAFGVPVILSSAPVHTCLWNELPKNFNMLFLGNDHLKHLRETLAETKLRLQMQNVKNEVGDASIDEFGTEPGWMYFNDLNYRPRPTPITFAAFNGPLIKLNERFYREDKTAPEYLMARFFAIQDRFGAQDDPGAVLEITRRYFPFLVEKTHLLLKRRPAPQSPPKYEQIKSADTQLGEFVQVPQEGGCRIWCRAKISYSILGHLRAFVCKPGPVYIQLESFKGEIITKRFLASSGDAGFSISPLIYDTQTLLNFYAPDASALMFKSYKLRFVTRPQDAKYFNQNINVSFDKVDFD